MKRFIYTLTLALLLSGSAWAQYYVVPGVGIGPNGGTNYVFPMGSPFKVNSDTLYVYPQAAYRISPLYDVGFPYEIRPLWAPDYVPSDPYSAPVPEKDNEPH